MEKATIIYAVWKPVVRFFRPPVVVIVAVFGLIVEFLMELPFRIVMRMEKPEKPHKPEHLS